MSEIICKQCSGKMVYREGKNKAGKSYKGWFCQNPDCKAVEWVNTTPIKETDTKTVSLEHTEKTTQPDWDAKDRRIVRQNALSHATELAKSIFETSLENRIKKVMEIAATFENWVYRK